MKFLDHQITLEPNSSIVVQIDVTYTHDLYDLALSSNSGERRRNVHQTKQLQAVEAVLR
ncbi:hypothetical protein [Brevibacillus centrosporus]|uniref:hypothetical protein n=1 Tax=Brevibacillus centrosporus TaxID=54910 RepID=UPI002E1F0614|nr:hypothetical protein [Brevibacillus centrosporus]